MSMILLAVVEDMPKFSISSNRKGRGSFSGVPLIGKRTVFRRSKLLVCVIKIHDEL